MIRATLAFIGLALSACATAPPVTTYAATPPSAPVAPITVLLTAEADPNAPRVNQWGGEVPEAAPAGPVIEGALPPLKGP